MSNPTGLQTPGSPGAPLARPRMALAGFATVAALLAGALPWTAALAQRGSAQAPATHITNENGAPVPLTRPSGLNLFAEADVAASGMRMTGGYGWQFPNVGGPCPWYFTVGGAVCGRVQTAGGGFNYGFFEYGFTWGVPISDFRKIRAVHPGVNNMSGPLGYATPYRFTLAPPISRRLGAADGQFGSYFSGVTSTEDGSCRDHTSTLSGNLPAGVTLTAGSDCPATWANGQFDGQRLIRAETFLTRAQSSPAGFSFDPWRVPRTQQEEGFLGDFSTYGAFSDHYREVLQRYGGVTKQGTGPSSERGFPLGIEVRYDAWQFARPSIRNVVWYQMTIVNRSAQIYGTGVDFDSLYFALTPGHLQSGSGSQSVAWYFDMDRNAVLATGHGTSGRCSATYPLRTPASGGCVTTRGFGDGNHAFVILKSPLGDTRNKLFTRPGSPFAAVSVPATIKDDTITFNHARSNGFGALANGSVNRNDKAFFGFMASIEDVFLDGRTVADFASTPNLAYRYFMSEQWRSFTGTLSPEFLRFPRFVPGATTQPVTPQNPNPGQLYGSWDYNNDGVQDTISVPGCGSRGCHDIYSDTLAAGTQNVFGNVINVISMGPVKLRAGDTTQILIAHVGASDSLAFESGINAAIDTYLNFYAGPAAITPPALTTADVQVTSAEVRDVTAGTATAQIRLRIPQLGSSADPFIARVADQIRTSTAPNVVRLRNLNPGLVAAVEARARNNLAEILVFKSCDRGTTFTTESYNQTTGAGCRPARARDPQGRALGFGWQAFRTIPVDTANNAQTRFITDVVQAGRTYLYTFVTRTRGLIDIPLVDSVGGRLQPTNLAKALSLDADTIVSALARSGPATVLVYAPISLPAGTRAAVLDTATISGLATVRVAAEQTGGELTAGSYRVYFANRFVVTTRQEVASQRITSTEVRAQRVLTFASQNGTTRDTAFVSAEEVFTADGQVFADADNLFPRNLVSTTGNVRIFVDTIRVAPADTTGYVLARTSGGTQRALYISRTSRGTGAGTRSQFENVAFFPGFRLNFEAPTAGVNVPRRNAVIRAEGDTVNQGVVSSNGVTVLAAGSSSQTLLYFQGGNYRIQWSDDAFGPGANFTYTTRQALQEQVSASLAARNNVSSTVATDALRALVARRAAQSGQDTIRPLQVFQLPFRFIGSNGQPAQVAMFRRYAGGANAARDSAVNNSRLLGNAGDTTRVTVPMNLWLPGDTLYVVETVQVDSTVTIGGQTVPVVETRQVAGRQVRAPIQVQREVVSMRLVLGCNSAGTVPGTTAAPRCNPLTPGTFAATGYLPYRQGWTSLIEFARPFDLFSELEVRAQPTSVVGVQLAQSDVADIRVVPNPYIVQSGLDEISGGRVGTPRVMFTGVPVQGMVRVYSVSGQLIQQLSWTESDLTNIGTGRTVGDLPFRLRSREGLDMGSGLYMFVLESTGTGPKVTKRGKFVIIR